MPHSLILTVNYASVKLATYAVATLCFQMTHKMSSASPGATCINGPLIAPIVSVAIVNSVKRALAADHLIHQTVTSKSVKVSATRCLPRTIVRCANARDVPSAVAVSHIHQHLLHHRVLRTHRQSPTAFRLRPPYLVEPMARQSLLVRSKLRLPHALLYL